MAKVAIDQYSGEIRFVDLFCGIGGLRFGAENAFRKNRINSACVFSSDIDAHAQKSYLANFGERPVGDISQVAADDIPDHDLLFAGFPCQPFSIIGKSKGFEDTRGTLFFEIARILEAKKPAGFILENVKRLVSHDEGKTLRRIITSLESLDYKVEYRALNALDFGLPQKRERVFIVGWRGDGNLTWPESGQSYTPLDKILEPDVDQKYYASEKIRENRRRLHTSKHSPAIWHENKSGNISSYPYSCALRAGASYNYLLVNGERRLTPVEMLRLQGFPENFKIVCADSQIRKQAGNAVPVSVVERLVERVLPLLPEGSQKKVDSRQRPMAVNI